MSLSLVSLLELPWDLDSAHNCKRYWEVSFGCWEKVLPAEGVCTQEQLPRSGHSTKADRAEEHWDNGGVSGVMLCRARSWT